jgi:hypothetical protein
MLIVNFLVTHAVIIGIRGVTLLKIDFRPYKLVEACGVVNSKISLLSRNLLKCFMLYLTEKKTGELFESPHGIVTSFIGFD